MSNSLTRLLTDAANGNEEAKATLLEQLYPEVQRKVHLALSKEYRPQNQWMLSLFSTGDIVQDVFLGVCRGLSSFKDRDETELRSWIAAQVKNRIIDRIRFHQAKRRDAPREKKPRDAEGNTVLLPARDPSPSTCVVLDERAAIFDRALAELGERETELWHLRFQEEKSFAEVATAMGYSSAESARAAFRDLRAKLTVRLRRLGLQELQDGGDV